MRGANPNGPRAQIKREAAEFGAKIITCFESYGRLTAFQVHELLGDDVKLSRVRQRLCRMVAEGDLHSEMVKGEKSPSMAIYALGPNEEPATKERAKPAHRAQVEAGWQARPIRTTARILRHSNERQHMNTLNTAPIQSAELAELRKLAEAATPGPWARDTQSGLDADVRAPHAEFPEKGYPVALTWGLWNSASRKQTQDRRKGTANANADYIAAANPATILRLLAALAAQAPAQQASIETLAAFQAECAAATKALKDSDAALAAQEQAKPTDLQAGRDGWKLVPLEPTEAMQRAWDCYSMSTAQVYRAMLAAAPTPPGARELKDADTDDTKRMDWLQRHQVDTFYMDDGRIVDIRGGDVRKAIDAAIERALSGNTAAKGE